MDKELHNLRINSLKPLFSPQFLFNELPLTEKAKNTVMLGRKTIENILDKKDNRIMVITGPCSIHDPQAALEYARKLKDLSDKVKGKIFIIMRVYFEKPRTTVGWKGLINDPDLNSTFNVEKGLRTARKLLLEINELGLPAGTEALDPMTPQYIGDLISWSAIGARTSESQTHREMSSGLSTAVGFKNATDGSLEIAINAIQSASQPHRFLGIDDNGLPVIIHTKGNPYGHIVLRGGNNEPNYSPADIAKCIRELEKNNLVKNLIVDCSHANSYKKYELQPQVFKEVVRQVVNSTTAREAIVGLMLESNLNAGNQKLTADLSQLKYGVSITDACIDWATTEALILEAHQKL